MELNLHHHQLFQEETVDLEVEVSSRRVPASPLRGLAFDLLLALDLAMVAAVPLLLAICYIASLVFFVVQVAACRRATVATLARSCRVCCRCGHMAAAVLHRPAWECPS